MITIIIKLEEYWKMNASLTLYVENRFGDTVTFRIPRSAKLSTVMGAYCQHRGLDWAYFQIKKTGCFCGPDDTPHRLKLQEGDVILAFSEMDNV